MTPGTIALIKILANLGGVVVVAYLLIRMFGKLMGKYGTAFIATQEKMAEAMGRNAESLAGMNKTVTDFVSKDSSEHQEIILGLQVVGSEVKTLTHQVKRLADERGQTQPDKTADIKRIGSQVS
jgi:hypothetical protein